MVEGCTPTAPVMEDKVSRFPDPPPSYEEVMSQDAAIRSRRLYPSEAPTSYQLEPTAPPAESDDETSSTCSSCSPLRDNSDSEADNNNAALTKRQKRLKFGFKVASYTVIGPLNLFYKATRTRDPYHEDNDKSHFCSSLARKTDKLLFGTS